LLAPNNSICNSVSTNSLLAIFRNGPKTVKAVLKAVHDASVWLDDLKNRSEQCDIVSRDAYIKCNKDHILGSLMGQLDYGDGRKKEDTNYMIFSSQLQLPANRLRQMVGHAVAAVGHGRGHP